MATKFFSIFNIWQALDQSILSLRLASTTADLIPHPFQSGIEEQIPVVPGRIQVTAPSLITTESLCVYVGLLIVCRFLYVYRQKEWVIFLRTLYQAVYMIKIIEVFRVCKLSTESNSKCVNDKKFAAIKRCQQTTHYNNLLTVLSFVWHSDRQGTDFLIADVSKCDVTTFLSSENLAAPTLRV